ncbi:MAG: hypothetical protein COA98_07380 [Candidatus Neomarinimicrobiota bacterium]|nr:MAG: hypothetical protein COA98_07380 [Candidatus Neomarinimicrobiota bacterium]
MKQTLLITTALIITVLMLVVGCGSSEKEPEKEPINFETTLIESGGVWYTKGDKFLTLDKPYSGPVFSLYSDGEKKVEATFKDGKEDGLVTKWYKNGQKKNEGNYKDGEPYGLHTGWYKNGQKFGEATFKDGELIQETRWDEDGQINFIVGNNEGGIRTAAAAVIDIDGNVYQTVQIGDQVWMAENLKVTHFRNGDAIPNVLSSRGGVGARSSNSASKWDDLTTGAYAVYDNNESNADTYGYLYNWYAVDDSRNIAPEGWHVPTDDEWQTLVDYLGGSDVAGGKMKSTGTIKGGDGLWKRDTKIRASGEGTNEGGFTGLPGGFRKHTDGGYSEMRLYGYFWSTTVHYGIFALPRMLAYSNSKLYRRGGGLNKRSGFSVRCIRD